MYTNMTAAQHVATEMALMASYNQALTEEKLIAKQEAKVQAAIEAHEKAVETSRYLDVSTVDTALLEGAQEVVIQRKVGSLYDSAVVKLPKFEEVNVISVDLDSTHCNHPQYGQALACDEGWCDATDDVLSVTAGFVYAEKRNGSVSVFMVKEAIPGEEQYTVLKLAENAVGAKMMEDIQAAFLEQEEEISCLHEVEEELNSEVIFDYWV